RRTPGGQNLGHAIPDASVHIPGNRKRHTAVVQQLKKETLEMRVDNHRRREAMNKSFWTSCLSRVLLAACLLAPAVAWADPVQEFRARINAATAEHASAAEPVARIQDIVIPGLYGDIPLR